MLFNNTRAIGIVHSATLAEEFEEFDRLSADLREISNYAPIKIASGPIIAAVRRYGEELAADRVVGELSQRFPDWTPI